MADQPIIILGYSRSGSNLIAAVIAAATNGVLNIEAPHSIIFRKAIRAGNINEQQWSMMLNLISSQAPELFRSFPDHVNTNDLRQFFSGSIINPATANGPLIEKFTKHSIFCNQLEQTYPNAKFIILIRDCTTVIERRIANKMAKSESAIYQAKLWEINYRSLWEFDQKHSDKCLIIRFEDMIKNEKKVLPDLAQFLQIDLEKLSFDSTRQQQLASSLESIKSEKGKHNALTNNVSDLSSKPLSTQQTLKVNRITNRFAMKFGYPEQPEAKLSLVETLKCWKAVYDRRIKFYYLHLFPPNWISKHKRFK